MKEVIERLNWLAYKCEDKAIEYINGNECCEKWKVDGNMVRDKVLNILKGEDNVKTKR